MLDDEFRGSEYSVCNPSGLEKRHHLPALDMVDESIGKDAFKRVSHLESYAIGTYVDG